MTGSFILIYILLGHFIGDFIFQSHKMATRKSSDSDILALHVTVYSLTVSAFLMIYLIYLFFSVGGFKGADVPFLTFLFFVLTFGTHYLTDTVTSRIGGVLFRSAMDNVRVKNEYEAGRNFHDFFVVIGFDQFIHVLTLWGTLTLLKII
jgi:hypothetical protein